MLTQSANLVVADGVAELPKGEVERFPTPTELLAMPRAERERWMQRSFALAADETFEIFDAFGEEAF